MNVVELDELVEQVVAFSLSDERMPVNRAVEDS